MSWKICSKNGNSLNGVGGLTGGGGNVGSLTRTESQLFRQYIATQSLKGTEPGQKSAGPLGRNLADSSGSGNGSKNALADIPGFGADSGSTPDVMKKYYAEQGTGGAS